MSNSNPNCMPAKPAAKDRCCKNPVTFFFLILHSHTFFFVAAKPIAISYLPRDLNTTIIHPPRKPRSALRTTSWPALRQLQWSCACDTSSWQPQILDWSLFHWDKAASVGPVTQVLWVPPRERGRHYQSLIVRFFSWLLRSFCICSLKHYSVLLLMRAWQASASTRGDYSPTTIS